jgi:hypothetical protein
MFFRHPPEPGKQMLGSLTARVLKTAHISTVSESERPVVFPARFGWTFEVGSCGIAAAHEDHQLAQIPSGSFGFGTQDAKKGDTWYQTRQLPPIHAEFVILK